MASGARAIPPLFRLAILCVLLAAVLLLASLIFAPPPLLAPLFGKILPDGWRHIGESGSAGAETASSIVACLPQLAALLGLLAGMLGLFAGTALAAPPPAPAASAAYPLPLGLQPMVQELRDLLAEERGELASLRELCGTATHDAMMVGARLAGVALDAETRLAAGVTQAEQGLHQHPADMATRAAEAVLSELIRRKIVTAGDDAQAGDVPDTMSETAARLVVVVDSVVGNFGALMTDAAEQIAALGDVATRLRRDAAALDMVGREVAMAGASVVSRLGDATSHADTVLTRLPDAAMKVAEAADQAARVLAEFQTPLPPVPFSQPAAFASSAYSATQDAAAARLVAVVDSVAQTLGDLMTETASQVAGLGDVTDGLRRDIIALDTAGRGIALAGAGVASRAGEAVAQASTALAQLPLAAALVTDAAAQAGRMLADSAAMLRDERAALAAPAHVPIAGENQAAAGADRLESVAAAVAGEMA